MFVEIIENVFLGDMTDALEFDKTISGSIIVVLEQRPSNEPHHSLHIPILGPDGYAHSEQLDKLANVIDSLSRRKKPVLVHCMAGIERSPLAIVWYLYRYYEMTLDDAYQHVITKRNQVANRLSWVRMD